MRYCPNINSQQWKEHVKLFPEIAYALWHYNNGNELQLASNGNKSNLFKSLTEITDNESEAVMLKGKLFISDYMFDKIGVFTKDIANTIVDENKEPKILYEANVTSDGNKVYTTERSLAVNQNEPGIAIGSEHSTIKVQNADYIKFDGITRFSKLFNQETTSIVKTPENKLIFVNKSKRNIKDADSVQQWLHDKISSDISLNIVDNLINNGLFALVYDKAIYLDENSDINDAYHEAFHIVYDNVLSKAEKDSVLNELKTSKKYASEFKRLSKVPSFKNMSDSQIAVELLAEEFKMHMVNVNSKSNNVISKIFDKIKSYIKNLFKTLRNEDITIEELFNGISNGNFKALTITSSKSRTRPFDINKDFKLSDDSEELLFTNEAFKGDAVESMVSMFRDYIVEKHGSIASAIKILKDNVSQKDIFNYIYGKFTELQKTSDDEKVKRNSEFIINHFDQAQKFFIEYLVRSIKASEIDSSDVLDGMTNITEKSKDMSWELSDKSISINPQMASPALIRLVLSTFQTEETNQFGVKKLLPFGDAFRKLSNLLTGSRNGVDVLEQLEKLKYHDINFYNRIKNEILTPNSIDEIELYLKFVQTFAKQKNDFKVSNIDTSGNFIISDASKTNLKEALRTEWTTTESIINDREAKKHNGVGTISGGRYNANFENLILDRLQELSNDGVLENLVLPKSKNVDKKTIWSNGLSFKIKLSSVEEHDNVNKLKYFTSILPLFGINIDSNTIKYLIDNPMKLENASLDLSELNKKVYILIQSAVGENANRKTNLFSTTEDSNNTEDINFLLELEEKYNANTFENSHYNIDGNQVYDSSLYTYVSNAIKDINELDAQGDNKMYHLDVEKNTFIKNSLIFNASNPHVRKELSITINEGLTKSGVQQLDDSIPYSKLSPVTKLMMQFLHHKMNYYPILRPGSNKIERWLNINFNNLYNKDDSAKVFVGYLIDELKTKNKFKKVGMKYNNISTNDNIGPIFSILRSQNKDISELLSSIANTGTTEQIDSIIQENISTIKSHFDSYILNKVGDTKNPESLINVFIKNNLLVVNSDGKYSFRTGVKNKRDTSNQLSFKNLSKSDVVAELESYFINTLFSNNEQFKMFFSPSNAYADLDSIFKRLTSSIGPIMMQNTDATVNTWMNENMTRVDGKESNIINPLVNSVTLSDALVYEEFNSITEDELANYSDEQKASIKDSISNYRDSALEEGDGASWVTMDSGREFLFRNSDWSLTGNKCLEDLYQYEQQRYVAYLISSGEMEYSKFKEIFKYIPEGIVNKEGFKQWIKKANYKPMNPHSNTLIDKKSLPKLNSLKPLHYGPYADNSGLNGIFKTSFTWLLPSMVINYETSEILRPNMLNTIEFMRTNQIDVLSNYSANKGVSTKLLDDPTQNSKDGNGILDITKKRSLPSLYTNYGAVDLKIKNVVTQKTYYKYWGIQVQTGFDTHDSSVFGTQAAAQLISNVYDNTEYVSEDLHNIVQKYTSLNKERLLNNFEILKDKFGIKQENGKYYIDKTNYDKLAEELKNSSIASSASDNIVDNFDLLNEEKYHPFGFNILLNARNAESVLMSMADKMTISAHVNGKQSFQIPSTLLEFNNREFNITQEQTLEGGKRYLTSNELKFYESKDGNISSIEVFLPSPYKGVTNLNQLPENDAEKLIYDRDRLLNIIGFRIPTQSLSSIESIKIKGFLPSSFGDVIVLPSAIVKKAGSDYDIDKMFLYVKNIYKSGDGSVKLIKHGTEEELQSEYDKYLGSKLEQLADRMVTLLDAGGALSKKMSYMEFKAKAIENELFHTMHEIITHKDNFQNLIQPLDNDLFKDAIEYLEELYNSNVSNKSFDLAINPIYVNSVATRSFAGASGIGPAAIISKFHILSQMSGLKFVKDTIKIRKDNVPSKINLNHNSDESGILLGSNLDSDGNKINNTINAIMSGAVDNVKNPVFGMLNINEYTLSTVLYLTLSGTSFKNSMLFINQPIIREFINAKDIYQSEILKITADGNINGYKKDFEILNEILKVKPNYTSDIKLTTELLENNIKTNSREYDAQILGEFLKDKQVAGYITDLALALTYDTNSFGGSIIKSDFRTKKLDYIVSNGFFSGLKSMYEGGFITPYKQVFDDTLESFKEVVDPIFTKSNLGEFMDTLTTIVATEMDGHGKYSEDDYVNYLYKIKNGFMNYMITSGKFTNEQAKMFEENLFSLKDKGVNSIVAIKTALLNKQNGEKLSRNDKVLSDMYEGSKLFEALEILDDANDQYGYIGLKFNNRKLDIQDSNTITQELNRLAIINPAVLTAIINMQIRQFGVTSGVNGFANLLPFRKFAESIVLRLETAKDKLNNDINLIETIRLYTTLINYNDRMTTISQNTTGRASFLNDNAKRIIPFTYRNVEKDKAGPNGIKPQYAVPNIFLNFTPKNEDGTKQSVQLTKYTDNALEYGLLQAPRNGRQYLSYNNQRIFEILYNLPAKYKIMSATSSVSNVDSNTLSTKIINYINSLVPNYLNSNNKIVSFTSELKSLQMLSLNENSKQELINNKSTALSILNEWKNGNKDLTSQLDNILANILIGKLSEDGLSESDIWLNLFNIKQNVSKTIDIIKSKLGDGLPLIESVLKAENTTLEMEVSKYQNTPIQEIISDLQHKYCTK